MERTVVLVKPDAYERGLLAEITRRFESSSLQLVGAKMIVPTRKLARAHYALTIGDADGDDDASAAATEARLSANAAFLSAGPVVALAFEGARAVLSALAIAGDADPRDAQPGTVRGDLASAPERNLVEVSPDAATAKRELSLWFKPDELAAQPADGGAAPSAAPSSTAAGCTGGSAATAGPRLPRRGERNVLVTSALPYVNNVPHLGNIIGCVLSADVYARYLRQRRVNVIYMCGTDEYGTATEIKALAEGLTPQQICDKYHAIHRDVYAWFDIRFDQFGRTSTPEQTEIVQAMFWDVHANGYTLTKTTEQLYSEPLGKFLADRYVQGSCPLCGYDDARGDQCDACGKLLNPTELINPRCVASGTTPVVRTTEHMYIDLPRLAEPLEQWIGKASVDGFWTHNSLMTTNSWLKGGLQPRCITRDLKWGVQVPLDGWGHKVFYVWFDAPIGYISITAAYAGSAWREWWQPEPEMDVKLMQFMGKDNIPFHTVIFPATLIASGRPWLRMHHISTTEYLNYEEGKFSKSRGTGVFGDSVQETGIPVCVLRYYLLATRPEASDSAFRWDDLAAKNNNELLANLGNFVNRATTFTKAKFGGLVPEHQGLGGDAERKLVREVNESLKQYHAALENVSLREGLRIAMVLSRLGNAYLQDAAPWKSIKLDPPAAATCCAVALNLCRLLAVVFEPYMGAAFSAQLFRMLGLEHTDSSSYIPDTFELMLTTGHPLGEPELLFRTITDEEVAALRARFGGTQEEATSGTHAPEPEFAADLRVGEIVDVQPHAESIDRLWVLSVDLGSERRQIVAGVREHYAAPSELLGKKVVIVCNLKAVSLRGVESRGMMLCAAKKEEFGLLLAPQAAPPGARVFAGELRNPGEQPGGGGFTYPILELKEFQKIQLTVGAGLVGMFKKAHPLNVDGAPVVAERVSEGAKIK
ncbi:hypothetical protein KFE25_002505 [Diacronema lutheri]|uniref:methionine--tRNA ligase n=2 Tax=Diacronema lutheri TaxID=2081491 RepID=A0A8J6C951_DIALT|nr:hypothetical protein KFE25_002505 [Diacronema lutheri]